MSVSPKLYNFRKHTRLLIRKRGFESGKVILMDNATKGNGRQVGLLALEAATAEIRTASVMIRTLRVDSRQLTMGTFRQLQKRPMIDEKKVELLGVVWGWVNYDTMPGFRSFVVQFGEKLCRCVQPWNDDREKRDFYIPALSRQWEKYYINFLRAWVYAGAIDGTLVLRNLRKKDDASWEFGSPVVDRPFSNCRVYVAEDIRDIIRSALQPEPFEFWERDEEKEKEWDRQKNEWMANKEWDKRMLDWYRQKKEMCERKCVRSAVQVQNGARLKLREMMNTAVGSVVDQRNCDWFLQVMGRCEDEYTAYWGRWNELMDRLRSVEQLFIAT